MCTDCNREDAVEAEIDRLRVDNEKLRCLNGQVEDENKQLCAIIERAYGHVGSMLPERLEAVNLRLYRQAVSVLKAGLG